MPFAKPLLRLAAAGLLMLVGIAMLQDHLLYFPAKATVAEMVSAGLRPWPSAQDFRGLVAEPGGTVRGTAIVFHGNAGHAGHRAFYAAMLAPLGLRVILAEYPGYGPRPGQLGERSLVADAEDTIARAHQDYGTPLLVIGESLGAGVVAAAGASQADKIAGLWLLTPWDRLASVAAHHYPWLPVGWLLRDRYDSAAHLAAFRHPVAVSIAEQDDIVPPRFGVALYQSLSAPKRLKTISGAGHNDWIEHLDANDWRETLAFLLSGGEDLR